VATRRRKDRRFQRQHSTWRGQLALSLRVGHNYFTPHATNRSYRQLTGALFGVWPFRFRPLPPSPPFRTPTSFWYPRPTVREPRAPLIPYSLLPLVPPPPPPPPPLPRALVQPAVPLGLLFPPQSFLYPPYTLVAAAAGQRGPPPRTHSSVLLHSRWCARGRRRARGSGEGERWTDACVLRAACSLHQDGNDTNENHNPTVTTIRRTPRHVVGGYLVLLCHCELVVPG